MSNEKKLFRGSLIPTTIAGGLSLIVSTLVTGRAGFFGALLAQIVVIFFFSMSLWVSKLTRGTDPMVTMAIAMASYFIKLFLMAGILILITKIVPAHFYNRLSFGISSIVAIFAWLGGEISSYLKLKTHLQLPDER